MMSPDDRTAAADTRIGASMPQEAKRVLIVYEDAGSGHRRAARIVEDALAQPGVQIQSISGQRLFGDSTARLVAWMWDFLIRREWYSLADSLINFGMRKFVIPIVEAALTPRYFRILEAQHPDVIVCTADVYNRLLGTYATHHGIPFFIVVTDCSVFIDLTHPAATHICYSSETCDAIRGFPRESPYYSLILQADSSIAQRLKYLLVMWWSYGRWKPAWPMYHNINQEYSPENDLSCIPIGTLVERRFFEAFSRSRSQSPASRDSQPVVLVASGSIGGRFVYEVVQQLIRHPQPGLTIVSVAGHDRKTARMVSRLATQTGHQTNLVSHGFVDNLEELLVDADVVVARPSAGIIMESIRAQTPLVVPSRSAANDAGCVELVRRRGLGEVFEHTSQLHGALTRILSDSGSYRQRIENFLQDHPQCYGELKDTLGNLMLDASQEVAQQHDSPERSI